MYGRPFLMKDKVYFDAHPFFLMRYAAKIVVDLETPAKQWIKTFPVVNPLSMKSKLLEKNLFIRRSTLQYLLNHDHKGGTFYD